MSRELKSLRAFAYHLERNNVPHRALTCHVAADHLAALERENKRLRKIERAAIEVQEADGDRAWMNAALPALYDALRRQRTKETKG